MAKKKWEVQFTFIEEDVLEIDADTMDEAREIAEEEIEENYTQGDIVAIEEVEAEVANN